MESNNASFMEAYDKLNENQKKAVDHIYGPVMAIAGPGTGKTQLLAVRVCHILAQTDMSAQNILCLTFTDAGATAMRDRLLSFMGADAYHVGIYTYHSFCNMILRENPELFSEYREMRNATDLEMVEIIMELLDQLPLDHPFKRLKGDIYYDVPVLKHLFSTMKQEGWTPQEILQSIEDYKVVLEEDDEYKYKRKYKEFQKGDLNVSKIKNELKKFDRLKHAAPLIDQYEKLLKKKELIDYHDSIHFVQKVLAENDMLLAYYQERYQFILADEYQDTNGSQNDLLFQLAGYDDQPNLFVVGDDDQSIYRFQGANMNNIEEYRDKFSPVEIVLTNNYRSTQPILDAAMDLIQVNTKRLAAKYNHLKKELLASSLDKDLTLGTPNVFRYETIDAQNIGVITKIKELKSKGIPLNEIGIIYKKHREVESLVKYFTFHKIPLNVKRKVNILHQRDAKRIITILRYIHGEIQFPHSKERELFSILHYDFFGLSSNEIAKVALYASRKTEDPNKKTEYRNIISDSELLHKIGVRDVDKMIDVSKKIEHWIGYETQYTIQMIFELILTESSMLNKVLTQPESTTRLQELNTLFNFIKEETATNPDMSLGDLIDTLDKMELHHIPINMQQVVSSKEGLNLMTAHGSKGLEFSHVFILNASEGQWIDSKSGQKNFKIPPTIFETDRLDELEDARRLFYVALTRAKEQVYISYPAKNENEKEMVECRFIHEMKMGDQIINLTFSEEEVNEYLTTMMMYKSGTFKPIDKDYVDNVIESMYMNATGIRKYLRCKTAFYFENILRVPMARTNNMGYGNAIHFALEKFVIKMKEDPDMKMPDLDTLLGFFKKGMDYFKSHFTPEEFEMSSFNGVKTLTQYYKERLPILNIPRDFRTEYSIKTEYKGIPISGIIDRVDIHDHHVDVTDYKTGRFDYTKLSTPNPEKEDKKYGGEQWFQVVFYKLLLDNDKRSDWKVSSGIMDFVQPEKEELKQKVFKAEDFDTNAAYDQLKETYDGIKAYDFSPGCQEDDCDWCQLVMQNMSLESPLGANKEEDENI